MYEPGNPTCTRTNTYTNIRRRILKDNQPISKGVKCARSVPRSAYVQSRRWSLILSRFPSQNRVLLLYYAVANMTGPTTRETISPRDFTMSTQKRAAKRTPNEYQNRLFSTKYIALKSSPHLCI